MKKLFHYPNRWSIFILVLLLLVCTPLRTENEENAEEEMVDLIQDVNEGVGDSGNPTGNNDETIDTSESKEKNPLSSAEDLLDDSDVSAPQNSVSGPNLSVDEPNERVSPKNTMTQKSDLPELFFDETDDVKKKASRKKLSNIKKKSSEMVEFSQVTNLEFKVVNEIPKVTLSFTVVPEYQETVNTEVKQVIYLFENTETPQKLQKAYDTSDFDSPVALFTLLEMPKKKKSKLIIQLREENKTPKVLVEGRSMTIEFPPTDDPREKRIKIASRKTDSLQDPSQDSAFEGKSIDHLEVKSGEVQDVLRFLAQTSGYNIVIGEDVVGNVGTLSLENVPWDQAFALVLQSKKLGYVRQGNILRVATLETLKNEKRDLAAAEESKVSSDPLRTVLIPVSYTTAVDLSSRVQRALSTRGVVDTDTRTNTLIVKDVDTVIDKVQKLVKALDVPPVLVSISGKIVEVKEDFTNSITGLLNVEQNFSGVNLASTLGPSRAGGGSTVRLTADRWARLNTSLGLGVIENKVKVIASPNVTVLNNRTASISQSQRVLFVVPGTATGAGSVQTIDLPLELNVTPIVAKGDGSITMTVTFNNQVPSAGSLGGGNLTSDRRSINTEVICDNGDTVMIGGIFQNNTTMAKDGIPLLMDIPILGYLVSTRSMQENRNEILIFLSPKILNAEEALTRKIS